MILMWMFLWFLLLFMIASDVYWCCWLFMLMVIGASELVLFFALLMDAYGCCCWQGFTIFAVHARFVIRTQLLILELSLLMFDVIPPGQLGDTVIYACIRGP